ncbi:helix-turn-helix domain-containing protein [Romeria aff. gracilis LEGE 07310]|uniref:Helix-turn-helix domain-containing protein n=1 Tax=Vasconcelosia minhoensis LEGE 07310 TaxID=915328 RepID=A0A8J7AWB1_9CYAN|nr:AraC family transcriptional regulator [Romeria gracilis]MBE9078303.1 helix-turn-helix domain-containing protein [Romeria aff. gracilis LEGE 07310]
MPSAAEPLSKTGQFSNRGLQPPVVSSQACGWKNILVEEFCQPPGEEHYQSATEHTLCLALSHRPLKLFQKVSVRTHISLSTKGDMTVTPAQLSLFSQWDQCDQYLRIRIASKFLDQVAQNEEASGRVELVPKFQTRNPHLEQIGTMLLTELRNGGAAGQLYVESLTNMLAVHLLRSYTAQQPSIALYEGGLTDYQLLQITDYIRDRLSDNIQLSDLAQQLGLSQFHFSRLFKQSTGVSPYQYVLQQRVEEAKQLLKTTKLTIAEIALTCGFSSHSHLGKWFRQQTGMTPKAFRKVS